MLRLLRFNSHYLDNIRDIKIPWNHSQKGCFYCMTSFKKETTFYSRISFSISIIPGSCPYRLLRTLMAEFNQTGDDLMELLAEQADGKSVITMLDSLNRVTLDVIGKVKHSSN